MNLKRLMDSLKKAKQLRILTRPYIILPAKHSEFHNVVVQVRAFKGDKKNKDPYINYPGDYRQGCCDWSGQKFKKAKSDATLLEIKNMNHILKEAPADEEQNLATYSKPTSPLNQNLSPQLWSL